MPETRCCRFAIRLLILAAVVASSAPASLFASLVVPLGRDIVVADGDGQRYDADVAVAGDGSILIVWTEAPRPGVSMIMAKLFDAEGRTRGDAFMIGNRDDVGFQARVRHDRSRNQFVVVWASITAGLLGQRLDTNGTKVGTPFEIARSIKITRDGFDFTIDSSGQLFAVWIGQNLLNDIFGTQMSRAGEIVGQYQLSDLQHPGRMPVVSAITSDFFIVAWASANGNLRTRTVRDRVLSTGVGGPFQDIWRATVPGWLQPAGESLVWRGTDSGRDGIVLSTLGAANPLPTELFMSGSLDLSAPVGAHAGPGKTLYAFSAARPRPDSVTGRADILGLAEERGSAIRLNTKTDGQRERPAIAVGPDGRFVVAWQEHDAEGHQIIMRGVDVVDSACQNFEHTACLTGGRFLVEVDWEDFRGRTGRGKVVPFTTEKSALFAFFDLDNWEVQVKVLDGCSENGHTWVFASATTNLGYTLTVTDLATGDDVTYTNPVGTPAPAITDTRAFVCP